LVQFFATVLLGIQVALLVFSATQHSLAEHVSLAGAILNLFVVLCMIVLLHLEYRRTVRPSFLVSTYLFVTVILDIPRVRTAWLSTGKTENSACLSASLITKLLILILENVPKRKWLLQNEKLQSGESTSGLFNRGLFLWLNGLLRTGYSLLLTGDMLPSIHEKLSSSDLSDKFSSAWESCDQNRQNALLVAIIKCLRWDIAAIALPRLGLVGFSIAQPFLIGKIVTYLESTESNPNIGYGLIGATAIVFIGAAVSHMFLNIRWSLS
jgi:ATP-binding cassette subfamily C (CFTR/MRP) protein 1